MGRKILGTVEQHKDYGDKWTTDSFYSLKLTFDVGHKEKSTDLTFGLDSFTIYGNFLQDETLHVPLRVLLSVMILDSSFGYKNLLMISSYHCRISFKEAVEQRDFKSDGDLSILSIIDNHLVWGDVIGRHGVRKCMSILPIYKNYTYTMHENGVGFTYDVSSPSYP